MSGMGYQAETFLQLRAEGRVEGEKDWSTDAEEAPPPPSITPPVNTVVLPPS